MSDEELDELSADLEELQAETREALAEELGGEPADYRVSEEPVSDAGE